MCSAPAACAQGRSYRACGDGAQCRIEASDGTTFHCASCADCTGASTSAANWCSGAVSSGGGADGGVSVGGGGGTSPDPTCATLLTCLANNLPGAFPAALQSYGSGGACWQDPTTAKACHDACQTSISDYQRSGECCLGDGDCRGNSPHCDLTRNATAPP